MSNYNIEQTKKYISDEISKSLKPFLHQTINKITIENIKNSVTRVISKDALVDKIDLDIKPNPDEDDKVDIIAKNLYTFLLLNFVNVPFHLIEDKDEYTYNGITYRFNKRELIGYIKPPSGGLENR